MASTNRYAGTCRRCRREVGAGEGRLLNNCYRGGGHVVECLDRKACQALVDGLPENVAKREARETEVRLARAEADERLACYEADGKIPDTLRSKTFTLPSGATGKRRVLADGRVRVKLVDDDWSLDLDYVSEAAAIVGMVARARHEEREIESRRINALPLPPVGATYPRKYRFGLTPSGSGSGTSMFLGTCRVDRLGEVAICAELMEDGSWLGYRDLLHSVRTGWEKETG